MPGPSSTAHLPRRWPRASEISHTSTIAKAVVCLAADAASCRFASSPGNEKGRGGRCELEGGGGGKNERLQQIVQSQYQVRRMTSSRKVEVENEKIEKKMV